MNTPTQLDFITSKISELQTAVFHSHSNSVLTLNPTVIRVLKIDDNGYIWFLVDRPAQVVTEFETQFPVALNFYKKGVPFFVNVFGIARIVIDPEELVCAELDNEINRGVLSDKILLSVKMANVNYYEKEVEIRRSFFGKLKKAVSEIFIPAEEFYYNPETQNDRHFA